MKAKKNVIVVAVTLVVVVVLAVAGVYAVNAAGPLVPMVSTVTLEKMDLANTVNVTGTVKSENSTNVYSTLSYQVKKVHVEVGDTVKEGDLLCELDVDKLQAQIDQQETGLANTQAKAQQSLKSAQIALQNAKDNQEQDYDAELQGAQAKVEAAQRAVDDARLVLDSRKLKLNSDKKASREYRDSDDYSANDGDYDAEYEPLRQAVQQGEISVEQAERAVEDAKKALEDAKKGLEITKKAKTQALVSSEMQVTAARLGTNFSDQWMAIEELKKDLENGLIKAPVGGVITAVLATEGGSGQGLLFVIEDTKNLMVTTKIKEYDLAVVKEGQSVTIKSDGTGEEEYAGKVTKIAPTAIKAANGATVETTDVQFETEITVIPPSKLRIGMNARMDILTEEKKGVFAVAFDVLARDAEGKDVVYVAQKQDDGTTVVKEIPVQTGMETDFYVEISAPELQEGDLIITDTEGLTDGMKVMPVDEMAQGATGARQGQMGGPRVVRMG